MIKNNKIKETDFAVLCQEKEKEYWQATAYLWACSFLENYELIYNYGEKNN